MSLYQDLYCLAGRLPSGFVAALFCTQPPFAVCVSHHFGILHFAHQHGRMEGSFYAARMSGLFHPNTKDITL